MLEGVAMFGLALGSSLVAVLVALDGTGTALVAIGLLMAVIALSPAARLHAVDRAGELRAAKPAPPRGSPVFAALSAPEPETLAP